MSERTALYMRVSTGEQTVENQRQSLHAMAAARGWNVVREYEDVASGAKGRDGRPALDEMMRDAARRKFDRVAVWAADRLGRSTAHVAAVMEELETLGVAQFYHKEAIDTSTPHGRAMIRMAAVFSELERDMVRERVRAGIDRARIRGTKSGRPIGRPKVSAKVERAIHAARAEGKGVRKIAREVGCGVGTVVRVLRENDQVSCN